MRGLGITSRKRGMNAVINDFITCKIGFGVKRHMPCDPKLDLMFIQIANIAFQYVTG